MVKPPEVPGKGRRRCPNRTEDTGVLRRIRWVRRCGRSGALGRGRLTVDVRADLLGVLLQREGRGTDHGKGVRVELDDLGQLQRFLRHFQGAGPADADVAHPGGVGL